VAVDTIEGINSQPEGALEELRREHEVAERLLERLAEIGERIKSGERVDPKALRFGVGLLDAYLHRVHAFQEDRELLPEARYVAMPHCFAYLDGMAPLHTEMRRRARELLDMISRWASVDESSRSAIGDRLVDLASLDHDVAGDEGPHPLMCLEGALPEAASQRLSSRFADHARTRAALEANIEGFLRIPEPERPRDPGGGRDDGRTVSGPDRSRRTRLPSRSITLRVTRGLV
jgi:hypothetical protein